MEIRYELTHKQKQAWDYLISQDKNCSILFGGAKGGGKSFLFCLWVFFWVKWLINFFGLQKSQYPLPLGFIGRKRSVDFTGTTLETWKQIIPAQSYELKDQLKEIIIDQTAKVDFGGLDDEETIKKFNSAEYAFIGVEQAEETQRDDLSTLKAALRRTHQGKKPPFKQLYTANPRQCWLKEDFIIQPKLSHYYIPALPFDNPYLAQDYITTLEQAFSYNEELLKAYRDGSWDAIVGQFFSEWLRSVHIIPYIDLSIIPHTKFMALDYGYAQPSSVGWYAHLPEGKIIRYRELYVTGYDYEALAEKILEVGIDGNEYLVADPSIWGDRAHHLRAKQRPDEIRGPSGAEVMQQVFGDKLPVIRGDNTRVIGWNRLRQLMKPYRDEYNNLTANFLVTQNCTHFIETIIGLIYDKFNPEDLDATVGETHSADEARYAVMSRPQLPVMPPKELTQVEVFWNRIKGDIAYHEKLKEVEEVENVFRQV